MKIVLAAFNYKESRSIIYRTHELKKVKDAKSASGKKIDIFNYDSLTNTLITALDRGATVISIRVLQDEKSKS